MRSKKTATLFERISDGYSRAQSSLVGLNHPDVAKVLDEFHRFKTEAARAAFAGSWLVTISAQLNITWPVVYELLALVREKELFSREGFLRDRPPFDSFRQFFEDVIRQPFDTWEELEATYHFVKEYRPDLIGRTLPEASEARKAQAMELAQQAEEKEKQQEGLPTQTIGIAGGQAGPGRGHKTGSDRTRFVRGETSGYLAARIARDHPDILERMKAGAFPSVRAAAIAAGIIHVPTPLEIAQKAWAKMDAGQRRQFREWIDNQ